MKHIALLTLGLATALAAPQAGAADYPSQPIRLIVPYVAGGAADITARVVAARMGKTLKGTIVVENKPGANGMIGTDFVAKAAPDGYTLLLDASGPLVVNPSLYKKTPYDPLKDFAPISQITSYQYALVVPQQSPAHLSLIHISLSLPASRDFRSLSNQVACAWAST